MTELTAPASPVPLPEPPPGSSPDPRRRKTVLRAVFEVALIALGVFFGLLVDQWRTTADHRQLAEASLRRIRVEFARNRDAVIAVRAAHDSSFVRIRSYLQTPSPEQARLPNPFESTSPAFLEYTAWEVAIATQALNHIPADLAQAIAHIYAVQRQLDDITRDITQVMYARIGEPDLRPFLGSAAVYFGDCALLEPRLIGLYDSILPQIDQAVGTP